MIDIKLLRDDPERVRKSQRARGEDDTLVDQILELDQRRRAAQSRFEALRAEQKSVSKDVGALMGQAQRARKAGADDAEQLRQQAEAARATAGELSTQVKELEQAADEAAREMDVIAHRIGNVIVDGVPTGGEEDFELRETVGTPRDFAAEGIDVKDHVELGTALGIIDLERGAKVAGSRFYYLKGDGARLEYALMGLCQQIAAEEGFVPLVVPNLVKGQTMAGAGFLDSHLRGLDRAQSAQRRIGARLVVQDADLDLAVRDFLRRGRTSQQRRRGGGDIQKLHVVLPILPGPPAAGRRIACALSVLSEPDDCRSSCAKQDVRTMNCANEKGPGMPGRAGSFYCTSGQPAFAGSI